MVSQEYLDHLMYERPILTSTQKFLDATRLEPHLKVDRRDSFVSRSCLFVSMEAWKSVKLKTLENLDYLNSNYLDNKIKMINL